MKDWRIYLNKKIQSLFNRVLLIILNGLFNLINGIINYATFAFIIIIIRKIYGINLIEFNMIYTMIIYLVSLSILLFKYININLYIH